MSRQHSIAHRTQGTAHRTQDAGEEEEEDAKEEGRETKKKDNIPYIGAIGDRSSSHSSGSGGRW